MQQSVQESMLTEVTRALEQLAVRPDRRHRIAWHVNALLLRPSITPSVGRYRVTGPEAWLRQFESLLSKLGRHLELMPDGLFRELSQEIDAQDKELRELLNQNRSRLDRQHKALGLASPPWQLLALADHGLFDYFHEKGMTPSCSRELSSALLDARRLPFLADFEGSLGWYSQAARNTRTKLTDDVKRPKVRFDKRKSFAADILMWTAGKAFEELTGQSPTVRHNPRTGKDYGPFLNLVADLFRIFKVGLSPTSQARKLCGEWAKKGNKNSIRRPAI